MKFSLFEILCFISTFKVLDNLSAVENRIEEYF